MDFIQLLTYTNKNIVVANKSSNPLETLFLATPNSNDQNQQFVFTKKDGAYLVTPRKTYNKAIQAPLETLQELFLDKIECHSGLQYFFFCPSAIYPHQVKCQL